MNKKVIIFDFDGVIVDSFSFCFKIVDSREYITEAEYRARFEGNIFDAVRKYKSPETKLEDFFARYTPELMKCEPIEGISVAIMELAKKYTLVIISSTITSSISDYLSMVGIRECFSEILGCDVEKSKVKKIQKVLSGHKIQPTDIVFVTDTLGDIREGEHCGVKSIAVAWGYNHREVLEKGKPYAIVKDPTELKEKVNNFFS